MSTRRVEFEGARGQRLVGRLELPPDGVPRATALFAHCFTCSKDIRCAVQVSRALAALEIGTLRFDFTGIGESAGDFAETTVSSNVDDLVAAAAFLERELGAPSLLVGHSLGGAAVLLAAGRLPTVRAVATIGAPAETTHVRRLLQAELDEIATHGEADVTLGGRAVTIGQAFVDDLDGARLLDAVAALDAALLLFHAPDDRLVGMDHAARLYTAAPHPKSFVSLAGADHFLSRAEDAAYVGAVLAAWAERYLPPRPEATREQVEEPTVVRVSTAGSGFRTEIGVRGHALVADEPTAMGGTDAGPTPYDLLAAALGACTTMTLVSYARRKGWPLREAVARLRHAKVYARDQDRCDDEPARLDRLERSVELVGELSDEQRARLHEIAGRCPVHRTLDAGVEVVAAAEEPPATG